MQAELDTTATTRPVRIFGVNQAGHESGNATICVGRILPWLQDADSVGVWTSWNVTFRDVIVLDEENRVVETYNLTTHDLANSTYYAELQRILLYAAD
jgi:hypothetical protein